MIEPASLWEVESMETKNDKKTPSKQGLHPLPSGKWNQWKHIKSTPKRNENTGSDPLPSGKWNQWKLLVSVRGAAPNSLPASLWEVESMETTILSHFRFYCTQEPASLWEVESMETVNCLWFYQRLYNNPLPSGKWNQWKPLY